MVYTKVQSSRRLGEESQILKHIRLVTEFYGIFHFSFLFRNFGLTTRNRLSALRDIVTHPSIHRSKRREDYDILVVSDSEDF